MKASCDELIRITGTDCGIVVCEYMDFDGNVEEKRVVTDRKLENIVLYFVNMDWKSAEKELRRFINDKDNMVMYVKK